MEGCDLIRHFPDSNLALFCTSVILRQPPNISYQAVATIVPLSKITVAPRPHRALTRYLYYCCGGVGEAIAESRCRCSAKSCDSFQMRGPRVLIRWVPV
jgi:hypothetical protein